MVYLNPISILVHSCINYNQTSIAKSEVPVMIDYVRLDIISQCIANLDLLPQHKDIMTHAYADFGRESSRHTHQGLITDIRALDLLLVLDKKYKAEW